MIDVSRSVLDELEARPEHSPLVGVVHYDSDEATIGQAMTGDFARLRRAVSQPVQGGALGSPQVEEAARRAVSMLDSAGSAERFARYALLFSYNKERTDPDSPARVRAAGTLLKDSGAWLLAGCPQEPIHIFCRETRQQVVSPADYGESPDVEPLPVRLASLIDALPDGIDDVADLVLTHTLPAALEYTDGSASEPPAHIRRLRDTELVWHWQGVDATRPHTITYDARPLLAGHYAITATIALTDTSGARSVSQALVGETDVQIGCAPTATPTAAPPTETSPPPTATATREVILRPLFLPVALNRPCIASLQLTDVALVVDASSSMAQEIRPGRTKLAAATDAVADFLDILAAGDQAALISFNESAAVQQPLTTEKASVLAAMRQLSVQELTRIDLGIERGHQELTSSNHILSHRPVLILLTDGKANPGGPEPAVEAARRAKDHGITIFSIGLGTVEALDFEALTAIASRPDFAYRTADADDLARIYAEIARALPCQTQ